MKTPLTVGITAAALLCSVCIKAFNIPTYSYEEMFAKSDLVVIAAPVASHDTGERTVDRTISPPPKLAGVVTECDAFYVLKGAKRKKFKLHHFKDISPPPKGIVVNDYPLGIRFTDFGNGKRYLMFLVRDGRDRFRPFDDQTIVQRLSIQEVDGITYDY